MSPEEPSIQEQEGSKPRIERDDERGALGQLSGRDGEEDEYTGPDPEQADDPPVPEEDQGV